MAIAKCTCKHDNQDKIHGISNRVFNNTSGGQGKCTICGTKKDISKSK